MEIKKTVFQLFVILLAVTMLSTFSMATSGKKYRKVGKALEQLESPKRWWKNPHKKLWRAVLKLKKQINTLSGDMNDSTADLQKQIDEIRAGQQNPAGIKEQSVSQDFAPPPLVCPGCVFPLGSALPEDVMARLPDSYLPGAWFFGVNLSGADLSGSNLVGAYFTGANLTGANLLGADLTGASGLETAMWGDTICSDSTNSDDNGGTCVGH